MDIIARKTKDKETFDPMTKISNSERSLLTAMSGSQFFHIHHAVLSQLGFEHGGMLQYLIDVRTRTLWSNKTRSDEWFYCTVERMERETTLTGRRQTRILKQLIDDGYIETKQLGGPPSKRHFRFCCKKIQQLFIQYEENMADYNEFIDRMLEKGADPTGFIKRRRRTGRNR